MIELFVKIRDGPWASILGGYHGHHENLDVAKEFATG